MSLFFLLALLNFLPLGNYLKLSLIYVITLNNIPMVWKSQCPCHLADCEVVARAVEGKPAQVRTVSVMEA